MQIGSTALRRHAFCNVAWIVSIPLAISVAHGGTTLSPSVRDLYTTVGKGDNTPAASRKSAFFCTDRIFSVAVVSVPVDARSGLLGIGPVNERGTTSRSGEPKRLPSSSFGLSGISASARSNDFAKTASPGKQAATNLTVTFDWIGPSGKLMQTVSSRVSGRSGSEASTWSWIQLQRPSEGQAISFFEPSYGFEQYIGKWKIEVKIKDKVMRSIEFDVIC